MIGASKGMVFSLAAILLLGAMACKGANSEAKLQQNAASPEQVRWNYQTGALTLDLKAAPDLNPFEGYTHNLMLCIYQMSDTILFEELAASTGGVEKLMTCNRFDPGVVDVQRHFVSPGETSHLVLDRGQGVRYVGIVAGYDDPQPGQVTALHAFPVTDHHHGWRPSARAYEPGNLNLEIQLNANSIHSRSVEQ